MSYHSFIIMFPSLHTSFHTKTAYVQLYNYPVLCQYIPTNLHDLQEHHDSWAFISYRTYTWIQCPPYILHISPQFPLFPLSPTPAKDLDLVVRDKERGQLHLKGPSNEKTTGDRMEISWVYDIRWYKYMEVSEVMGLPPNHPRQGSWGSPVWRNRPVNLKKVFPVTCTKLLWLILGVLWVKRIS